MVLKLNHWLLLLLTESMAKKQKSGNLLLPNNYKYLGVFLFLLGIALVIIRYYFDKKLEIFDMSVFAFYTHFLTPKFFAISTNNLTEEFGFLFLYSGLFIIAFSKMGNEKEELNAIRLRSILLSIYINSVFLIVAMFTFFGVAIFSILSINLISTLVLYNIIFYWKYLRMQNTKN
jgi:hypothetical protein